MRIRKSHPESISHEHVVKDLGADQAPRIGPRGLLYAF